MIRRSVRLSSAISLVCLLLAPAPAVAALSSTAENKPGFVFLSTFVETNPGFVSGVVVDAQGAPVLRARVRAIDRERRTLAHTVTDERGRFHVDTAVMDCRLEVSLGGFATAEVPCAADVRVALAPAPVRESVVVSATRDAAPLGQVGSSVTVLSQAEIQRRGEPLLADLLRAAPGVTVVQSGAPGTQTSVFVRGGDSSYNKVLLDGIPINEPGGTFNFSNLTTDQLERVELVRGAESALFGSDAMASVIQLFTRRASAPVAATFSAGAGSHDTFRTGASLSGRRGRGDASIGLTRFRTDNHVPNNAFRNTTASWNAAARLAARTSVRSIGRVEDGRVGTPGATAFGRADRDAFFDRSDLTAGVALDHAGDAMRHRLSYGFARTDQMSRNLVADPPFLPAYGERRGMFEFFDFLYDSRNVLRRHHVSYQLDWRPAGTRAGGAHFVTAAVDVDLERARLDNRLTGLVVTASRNNAGWTVQHQLVAARTTVTSGLRIERNETFGTAVVPRVAVVHELRRGGAAFGSTLVKVTAGTGVKEPTILQSFSPSPGFLGNPDLEPERSRAFSAAIEQRLVRDRAKLDVVWFDHRYRNQISTRTLGFTPFRAQYFNVGRTSAKGLELAVTTAPTPQLQARAGYTLLASRIDESTAPFNPIFAPGAWAFRRPRHSGFAELAWSQGRVDASVTGIVVGRRTDSDFASLDPPIVEAPAYAVVSLSTRYRAASRVDVTLRVENLGDTQYMEPLGFPAWGRAVHAGVRVRF
jgi:vitamin B12 transporter